MCLPSTLVAHVIVAAPVADVIVLPDSSDLEGHLLRMNNCHLLVSYCSLNKEHHKLRTTY